MALCTTNCFAQSATISGIVLSDNNVPLSNVNIVANEFGTTTNLDGFYILEITADTENTITFSHIAYTDVIIKDLILTTLKFLRSY